MDNQFYCDHCHRTMSEDNFYSSNNTDQFPNKGKVSECKKCFTRHVDNWKPDTYVPLLEVLDLPHIPDEWYKLLNTYGKNPEKLTGMTILGRYVSKMKLTQYREYRWVDTEHLMRVQQQKQEDAMKRQGYTAAEIETHLMQGPGSILAVAPPPENDRIAQEPAEFSRNKHSVPEVEYDLTEEDMLHLTLSWGHNYKIPELVKLEKMFEEMRASYDIQSAGHIDTLRIICKTSLKSHQLIDMGDIEGFQKVTKVYDSLMKSGNFTAAQNKSTSGEFVDSIGELVAVCEKEGFIPRYYTAGPQDVVDETLADIQRYCHELIVNEPNLANLIEGAIRTMKAEDEKEDMEDIEDELTYESLDVIKDEEFAEMQGFLEEEEEIDEEELLAAIMKDGD